MSSDFPGWCAQVHTFWLFGFLSPPPHVHCFYSKCKAEGPEGWVPSLGRCLVQRAFKAPFNTGPRALVSSVQSTMLIYPLICLAASLAERCTDMKDGKQAALGSV